MSTVDAGLGSRSWAPGATIRSGDSVRYYIPQSVLLGGAKNSSGDSFDGAWYYPRASDAVASYVKSAAPERVSKEIADKAMSYGWAGAESPEVGYMLTQEQFDKIFGSSGWSSVKDSSWGGMKLSSRGVYEAAGGSSEDQWYRTIDTSGNATGTNTHTSTDYGIFGGGTFGSLLRDVAPILQLGASIISPIGAAIGNIAGKAVSGQDIGIEDIGRVGIAAFNPGGAAAKAVGATSGSAAHAAISAGVNSAAGTAVMGGDIEQSLTSGLISASGAGASQAVGNAMTSQIADDFTGVTRPVVDTGGFTLAGAAGGAASAVTSEILTGDSGGFSTVLAGAASGAVRDVFNETGTSPAVVNAAASAVGNVVGAATQPGGESPLPTSTTAATTPPPGLLSVGLNYGSGSSQFIDKGDRNTNWGARLNNGRAP